MKKSISMITVSLLMGISLFISSCKKISIQDEPNSTFSFMADNVPYVFDGILKDKKGAIVYLPFITSESIILGQNSDYTYFRATMSTSTLAPGNYTAGIECHLNAKTYVSTSNFIVTITSNTKGLVSGTFSGEVYDVSTTIPTLLNITNGNFHDLKTEYTL